MLLILAGLYLAPSGRAGAGVSGVYAIAMAYHAYDIKTKLLLPKLSSFWLAVYLYCSLYIAHVVIVHSDLLHVHAIYHVYQYSCVHHSWGQFLHINSNSFQFILIQFQFFSIPITLILV